MTQAQLELAPMSWKETRKKIETLEHLELIRGKYLAHVDEGASEPKA